MLEISKNTTQFIRAPEQVDLNSGFSINEKVDIWALGIIIYNLVFYNKPLEEFCIEELNQVRKGNLFTEDMINSTNTLIIELLKMLLKTNPKTRASASEIIYFIEKNINNLDNPNNLNKINSNESLVNLCKKKYNLAKKSNDTTVKLFKRHSTQFWILKLTNENFDYPPKFKYIKNIVCKAWQKRQKIEKIYKNLSTRPLHLISIVALKAIYVLHHYIFLGPTEAFQPKDFDLDEFLIFFINLWNERLINEDYDKEDKLKNSHITKFIISYAEFLKMKILFHKKYPFVENNFSLDLILKSSHDLTVLIEKKFIYDLFSFFTLSYQKIFQIPIGIKNISKTLDVIIQILNEELYSIFSLLFYIIIGYKKYNSNCKNENKIKTYDLLFLENTNKIREIFEKLQMFRNEIKSPLILFSIPDNLIDFFKNLDYNIKFFPLTEFNLRIFFSNDLDIQGINLNTSIGRLIESKSFDIDYMLTKRNNNKYSNQTIIFLENKSKKNII